VVNDLAKGQIALAVAVWAVVEDMDFEHWFFLSLGGIYNARPRLKVESKAGWDRPCDGHGWLACTETNVRSPGVRAVLVGATGTAGNYLVVIAPLCSLFVVFTYIFKVETLPQ
jgi:hypothetical protein